MVRLNEADHHVGAALLALVAFLERSVGLAHAGSHAYQIGHGRRIEEAEHFYRRHPRWSLFGKMLRDSAAALDALGALPFVDPGQMWVVGYSLGALVGLHLCALDRRPAGLAAVCLPPPFRTDTDVAETGGFQRWARRSLLLLRLGYFEGHASQIPYDLDELLAALAPRPTLVVSPTLDHEAPLDRVTQAVERARVSFASQDAAERLAQVTPLDYNRFVPHVQNVISTWLRKQVRIWQGSEWPLPWRRGAG